MPAQTSILIRGVDDPRPESSLRFGAWRRIEVIRELKKYEDEIGPIDESQKKDALVQQAEAFIAMGRIPDPFKARVVERVDYERLRADSKEVGKLKEEAAERDAKIERLEAAVEKLLASDKREMVLEEDTVGPAVITNEMREATTRALDEARPAVDKAMTEAFGKLLSWDEIRAKAKSLGINIHGKKRPDLEKEIQAKEAGI